MLAGKGSIYSDRPSAVILAFSNDSLTSPLPCTGLILTGELGGWNQAIGASPNNERWRHMRRLFHTAVGTSAANKRFDSGKELEARRLLRNILAKPDQLVDHLRLSVSLFEILCVATFRNLFTAQPERQCSAIHMDTKLWTRSTILSLPSLIKLSTNSLAQPPHPTTSSSSSHGVSRYYLAAPRGIN